MVYVAQPNIITQAASTTTTHHTFTHSQEQTTQDFLSTSAGSTHYLGVENCPIHDAAAKDDPLGRDNEHQAGAQAGEGVGGGLPDRVLVRDLGQVFPWAVLSVVVGEAG